MSSATVRLRGRRAGSAIPYPLGDIPDAVLSALARSLVHRLAVGQEDVAGDDVGNMFAAAVGGEHRASLLGVADVVRNGCAWTVKTVKRDKPFATRAVRLISGRNSPDYSAAISDPRANLDRTGKAVLDIWNARVAQALEEHDELRVAVLVRNMATREFVLFEEEVARFAPRDYEWTLNRHQNPVAFDKGRGGHHVFTWQPHGSQFTIHRPVPASARRFRIVPNVPIVAVEQVLAAVGFADDWVDFLA